MIELFICRRGRAGSGGRSPAPPVFLCASRGKLECRYFPTLLCSATSLLCYPATALLDFPAPPAICYPAFGYPVTSILHYLLLLLPRYPFPHPAVSLLRSPAVPFPRYSFTPLSTTPQLPYSVTLLLRFSAIKLNRYFVIPDTAFLIRRCPFRSSPPL